MAKKFQLRERGTNEKIYPITVKEAVGLDNIDNTSDADKPVSTAQAAAIADAKKAGTDAQAAVTTEVNRANTAEAAIQATLDDHKADNDKKHIPAGGHEKQILTWESEGKAKWEDLSNMFPGLLEQNFAYGVEWNITEADPHLTRIGNMSLHKTLPIQSQLKGCIAQKDKVMYWLNENDWRLRKDPIIAMVDMIDGPGDLHFRDASVAANLGIGQYVRAIGTIGRITHIEGVHVTVEWEEMTFPDPIYEIEIGSRLDGYDGTVRVYCPNFYIKSQIIGNTRRVWLSTVKIDYTWTHQPEILIDAYRSTVLNTVPENMGYLSTLPINSAISVVNTATYCRGGGNRVEYDKYLTGADGTTINKLKTDLGKPRTDIDRATMRTAARNAGSEMLSYDQYKNIFYWLYVVEYANFQCQAYYNEELTNDGYHQGGLGTGLTNMGDWNQLNGYYPITPCGYGNYYGNMTGVKSVISPDPDHPDGIYMCRWRGFDNPFGDILTNLDGIIIDADVNGNHYNNMNYVYTCQDPTKYADSLNDCYKKVGEEINQDGSIEQFDLGNAAHIIPNTLTEFIYYYKCGWHETENSPHTLRTLFVGGDAQSQDGGNLSYFNSRYGVSGSSTGVGFRTVSQSVSFS